MDESRAGTPDAGPIDVGSTVLGRYRVRARLGAGGYGVVWRAWDPVLGREVALKHVALARPDDDAATRADRRARTLREGRVLAGLSSPVVVAIHDMVADRDDAVWLVLEYVPGRSLAGSIADAIEHGARLDPLWVGRVGIALARALAHGHARELVHRDVKPANVLVGDDGAVKLADYGIARFLDPGPGSLTASDRRVGSIAWSSPEWARGETVTTASDVFSLGATLFHAVEGHPPFGDDPNAMRLLGLVALGWTAPTHHAGPLGPVIESMLAVHPERRPDAATVALRLAEAVGDARESVTADPGPTRRVAVAAADDAPTGPVPPAPPASQRGRRGRRWLVVAGLVTAVALLAVATLVVLRVSTPARAEDPLTLPASLVPVDVTGDQRDLDPCALVDPGPLRAFGTPQPPQPGPELSSCTFPIARPGTSRVAVVADLAEGNGTQGITGSRQPLGAGLLVHQGGNPTNCRATITLSGEGQIALQGRSDDAGLDACRVVDAATALTVRGLDAHGLVRVPGRSTAWELGSVDSCTLATTESLDTVGLGPVLAQPASRGWGRWFCQWGRDEVGQPRVSLGFALENEAEILGRGTAQLVDGRTVVTSPDDGDTNARMCRADLLWRPSGHPPGLFQILRSEVDAPGPDDALCAAAVRVVDTAAGRLR